MEFYYLHLMRFKIYIYLYLTLSINSYAQNSISNRIFNSDSICFYINWSTKSNEQIQYSINKFTEDAYIKYSNETICLTREDSNRPNTWENNLYASEPCYFSTQTTKGNLNKVNTIRVRLIDTIENKTVKDSVYIIGFNNPHKHYVLFATADSNDHVEVFQNHYDNIKKRVWLHILKPDGTFEVSQPVEFDIAAASSACLPNKGVAFKATKDNPIKGPNNFKTSIFTKDYKEEIKKIKMRVGGNGQNGSFGVNEICLRIINYPDWKIGGVRNTVGTWYLNGSYWSLGFPQVKPNERYVAEEYHIDKDSVDIIYPINNIYFDTIYEGINDGVKGTFIVLDSIVIELYGTDTLFSSNEIPSIDKIIWIYDKYGKRIVSYVEEGNNLQFIPIFQALADLQIDTISDHYNTIDSLIDLDNWLRFLSLANYFGIPNLISFNMSTVASYRHKPFILMEDFDWSPSYLNNWDSVITSDNGEDLGILHEIIRNLILKSPKAIDRLILVYQDLLNTGLLSSRTVPIAEQMINEIMPEYGYFHQAWGGYPNGGIDSSSQLVMLENFKNFLETRPDMTAQMLTDRWQPKDSFNITDRKTITVIFDSIPENIVQLKLNSIKLDSNFTGLYFPNPDLQISYKTSTILPEYDILIKEYPDSSNVFNLSCDSNITITFVLRRKVVNNINNISSNNFTIYPNPTTDILTIKNKLKEKFTIEIYNAKGERIIVEKNVSFIDMSNFISGLYIVKIHTNTGELFSTKILKK